MIYKHLSSSDKLYLTPTKPSWLKWGKTKTSYLLGIWSDQTEHIPIFSKMSTPFGLASIFFFGGGGGEGYAQVMVEDVPFFGGGGGGGLLSKYNPLGSKPAAARLGTFC